MQCPDCHAWFSLPLRSRLLAAAIICGIMIGGALLLRLLPLKNYPGYVYWLLLLSVVVIGYYSFLLFVSSRRDWIAVSSRGRG